MIRKRTTKKCIEKAITKKASARTPAEKRRVFWRNGTRRRTKLPRRK